MREQISRRGGGIVNGLRFTWPLVSLTVTPTMLRMKTTFGGHYELRADEITRLNPKWRHLWAGIQVEHNRPDLPPDLFFMPLYRPRLVRDLARLGYTVA